MMTENDIAYENEKKLLSMELQKENCLRLNRIIEYKRAKILEKHKQIKEKSEMKKSHTSMLQNTAINRTFFERETSKAILNVLDDLKKVDPKNDKQRIKLQNMLNRLNSQFDLQLKLEKKSPKKAKKNDDSQSEDGGNSKSTS